MARTCVLRAFRLQMPCRFSLVLRLFCFVSFLSLCFRKRDPSFNRPSICRRPDNLTFFFFFFFSLFGDVDFPGVFFISAISLYGEYVVRSFLPGGAFSTLLPRAGFFTLAHVRIQIKVQFNVM